MVGIQTHDGLYDEANKKYFMGFTPEVKPRTSLPYILHFADMMAARIEFEREWLPKFKNGTTKSTPAKKTTNTPSATKQKALSGVRSEGLKNLLDSI
jgi:hypothetical protein